MTAQVQTDLPRLPGEGLQILTSQRGNTITITLSGEWGLAEQEATQSAFARALARSPGRLVLDLRRLGFMDSTGVHGTIGLARHAASQDVELVILPGPRAVQRVFEICELVEQLPFGSERPSRSVAWRPDRSSRARAV
jgi:anti-anti-sigma factor